MSTTVQEDKTLARLVAHMATVRSEWPSVVAMKQALSEDDYLGFIELWVELSHETQKRLWVAPRYGGIWTTHERKQIRQWHVEYSTARRQRAGP